MSGDHIIRSKCYFIRSTYRLLVPLCPSVNSIHLWIILFLGSSVPCPPQYTNYKGSVPHGILVVSVGRRVVVSRT